jgi:hypothetical protein
MVVVVEIVWIEEEERLEELWTMGAGKGVLEASMAIIENA